MFSKKKNSYTTLTLLTMDNLTPEQRKRNMKNIRSFGTKPEKIIMRELRKRKIYFAHHVKSIIGKPDIIFRRKKVAVFIDSDFWHANPDRFTMPKTNKDYWSTKISYNKQHDKEINDQLAQEGWFVIRLWEHDIYKNLDSCINTILKAINNL